MSTNDPYLNIKNPFEYILPPYCCKCLAPCTRKFVIRTEGMSSVGTFGVYLCHQCSRQMRIKVFSLFFLPILVFAAVAIILRDLVWVLPIIVIGLVGIWLMSTGFFSPAFSDGFSIQFRNAEYQKRFKEANSD